MVGLFYVMENDFQKWLSEQGYYRENSGGAWMKDGVIVTGKELNDKLNEWKALYNTSQPITNHTNE